MLKFEIIFLLAFLVINLVSSYLAEPSEIVAFCQAQEKATSNDLENWLQNIKPKPKILKCFEACIAEKTRQFVDNKLNVPDMETYIDEMYEDKKLNAIYKEILNECKSITDADRCEVVSKVVDCLKDGAKKRNVPDL